MFHFFSKIQNRISFKFIHYIKLLIQTIHKGGGLFGSYPKPDTYFQNRNSCAFLDKSSHNDFLVFPHRSKRLISMVANVFNIDTWTTCLLLFLFTSLDRFQPTSI